MFGNVEMPFASPLLTQFLLSLGFHVKNIHVEQREYLPSLRTGTGIAYVHFFTPKEAERARQSRHKHMMGFRSIKCILLVPGEFCPVYMIFLELCVSNMLHLPSCVFYMIT